MLFIRHFKVFFYDLSILLVKKLFSNLFLHRCGWGEGGGFEKLTLLLGFTH